MQSLPVAFGRTVRRLRQEQGYSQEAFAAKAKISRTYMSEVERGVTIVSLEVIGRVARGLGLSMSVLLKQVEEGR
jgi:transcriptional regulator with XRE-family HTH domain